MSEKFSANRRQFLGASGAAAAVSAMPAFAEGKSSQPFPKDFFWGAATSSYQTEGNNVASDCWLLEHVKPTVFAEPSGDAANSFERWPVDLQLIKNLSLGVYRFSLEWARIEPEPGMFSTAMLDHYKQMIAACHAAGIRPFVTYNHFTTPQWFAARGGWTAKDSPDLFARFCDRVTRHMGDGIDHAMTLNEPQLPTFLETVIPPPVIAGYKAMEKAAAEQRSVESYHAGFIVYRPGADAFEANLMAAHRKGKAAIKAARGDLPVGVTLAITDEQEAAPGSIRDAVREKFYGGWLRLARDDDFVGVQNYGRNRWRGSSVLPPPDGAKLNFRGEEVYAPSLANAVSYAHDVAQVPIIVTEHGVGTDDDAIRQWLIPNALTYLRQTIADGVPVKGYCHWSLIDNFEWIFGYEPKFGLHSLNRDTFERKAKPSALVYRDIAAANAV